MLGVHLFVIPFWITSVFTCAVAVVAFWKGDWRAQAISIPPAASTILARTLCAAWCLSPWKSIAFDGLVLVACLAGVVGARRYWVIWVSSFAILAVVSDFTAFVPGITDWAWSSATIIWTYMIGFATLWGIWETARERAHTSGAALAMEAD